MNYNDIYKNEIKQKYENSKEYNEYLEKTKNYSSNKWELVNNGLVAIFEEFAICLRNGILIDSTKVQELVNKLQKYFTDNYYTCTDEVLLNLASIYVTDDRFKSNIDKFQIGTAEYVNKAINLHKKVV